jgi:nicotinamidase-related amidase
MVYPKGHTAVLFVDPYNDFLSDGGKLWPMVSAVATSVHLHSNLKKVVSAARANGLPVIYVPHHRAEPNEFDGWDHPTPYQLGASKMQVFAKDTWGGAWHPDFAPEPGDTIAKEHWVSSGFANTDLDLLLKQKRISHLIMIGLIANTCIETTSRFAVELGYHVTLVRDATAAASPEAMHAAHEINGPSYAHAIVTAAELVVTITGIRG